MEESRKIWKAKADSAQYYCAAVFAISLVISQASAPAQAGPVQPDTLLNPPAPCAETIVPADLVNDVDVTGRPLAPVATGPQPRVDLTGAYVRLPVRTRVPGAVRPELDVDISGLLQASPIPACLDMVKANKLPARKP